MDEEASNQQVRNDGKKDVKPVHVNLNVLVMVRKKLKVERPCTDRNSNYVAVKMAKMKVNHVKEEEMETSLTGQPRDFPHNLG